MVPKVHVPRCEELSTLGGSICVGMQRKVGGKVTMCGGKKKMDPCMVKGNKPSRISGRGGQIFS